MLFLGAGASRPFGIPTMKEFTSEILKTLDNDASAKVKEIIERIEEYGFIEPDIEAVMDVLTARQDLDSAKMAIGPKIIEFSPKGPKHSTDLKASLLLESIRGQITERCAKADFGQSDAYYGLFFKEGSSGQTISGKDWIAIPYQRIFTTNYDLCIERFLRKHFPSYQDGFESRPGYGRVFTGSWPEGGGYTLCKLHGSIDWFEIEAGPIVQMLGVPGETLYADTIKGRSMVYPAGEKYALTSPYAECLFYLRESLKEERQCLVVGYSFRDLAINNAFTDAVRTNPELELVLLGPHASFVRETLEEPLKSKVKAVEASFGSRDAIVKVKASV